MRYNVAASKSKQRDYIIQIWTHLIPECLPLVLPKSIQRLDECDEMAADIILTLLSVLDSHPYLCLSL